MCQTAQPRPRYQHGVPASSSHYGWRRRGSQSATDRGLDNKGCTRSLTSPVTSEAPTPASEVAQDGICLQQLRNRQDLLKTDKRPQKQNQLFGSVRGREVDSSGPKSGWDHSGACFRCFPQQWDRSSTLLINEAFEQRALYFQGRRLCNSQGKSNFTFVGLQGEDG